jgi:hypothetical protein
LTALYVLWLLLLSAKRSKVEMLVKILAMSGEWSAPLLDWAGTEAASGRMRR